MNNVTISTLKNIYISLLDAVMQENINLASRFLDESLIKKYNKIIEKNKKNNVLQKYDLLNISDLEVEYEDNHNLIISAQVKYIDYKVDKKSGETVDGDDTLCEKQNILLNFKKNISRKQTNYKCPSCGADMNINKSSICDYCGKSIDKIFSPFILLDIQEC